MCTFKCTCVPFICLDTQIIRSESPNHKVTKYTVFKKYDNERHIIINLPQNIPSPASHTLIPSLFLLYEAVLEAFFHVFNRSYKTSMNIAVLIQGKGRLRETTLCPHPPDSPVALWMWLGSSQLIFSLLGHNTWYNSK